MKFLKKHWLTLTVLGIAGYGIYLVVSDATQAVQKVQSTATGAAGGASGGFWAALNPFAGGPTGDAAANSASDAAAASNFSSWNLGG